MAPSADRCYCACHRLVDTEGALRRGLPVGTHMGVPLLSGDAESELHAFMACRSCEGRHARVLLTPKPPKPRARPKEPWVDPPRPGGPTTDGDTQC